VRLIRLERRPRGELLHVGPYDKIGESVARMREFAAAEKLRFNGRAS